jgi:hypothetical protein
LVYHGKKYNFRRSYFEDDILTRLQRFGERQIASYSSHPELLKRAHNLDMLVAMNFGDKNLKMIEVSSKFNNLNIKVSKNLSTVLNPPKTKVEPCNPFRPNNTEDKSKDNKILKSNPKRKPKTLVE